MFGKASLLHGPFLVLTVLHGTLLFEGRAYAQDRVVPYIKMEVPETQRLTSKEQDILVRDLIRGVPTEISVTLQSPRLVSVDAIALVKSCSCFSAQVEDKPAINGENSVLLKIVTIPGERGFFQKVSFYRKSDQRHDGSGSGPQYDGALCIDSIRFVGKTIDPVSVQVADRRVPDVGEWRTITVKPKLGSVKIGQSDIAVVRYRTS